MLQEDVPAGEEESEGSEDSGNDDEDDSTDSSGDEDEEDGDEEKEDEPLSLDWPDTPRKQATYLLLLPIIFPLWLTIPDVRNQVKPQREGRTWLEHVNKVISIDTCLPEIQKILCGHLPGLHPVDRHLLLPHGVVGPSGQLLKHAIPPATFSQCGVKVWCASFPKYLTCHFKDMQRHSI